MEINEKTSQLYLKLVKMMNNEKTNMQDNLGAMMLLSVWIWTKSAEIMIIDVKMDKEKVKELMDDSIEAHMEWIKLAISDYLKGKM